MTATATPSTPVPTAPVTPHVFPPLTLADRSDASASRAVQALVRIVKGPRDLLLDGHTFSKNEADLIADGWTVYEDIRETASNGTTAAY